MNLSIGWALTSFGAAAPATSPLQFEAASDSALNAGGFSFGNAPSHSVTRRSEAALLSLQRLNQAGSVDSGLAQSRPWSRHRHHSNKRRERPPFELFASPLKESRSQRTLCDWRLDSV